jgi:hypothetical protein
MKVLLLPLWIGCAMAQPPGLEQILSRVATNQAKSQDMRKCFVYTQNQLLRMVRSNGRVAREERREYVVTPKERGFHKELAHFEGKYESKGKYVPYDHPGYEYKDVDIDGGLIDDLSRDLTSDGNSRDGIAHNQFPLTYHQQLKYDFKLMGTETYRGRQVWRIAFQPKKKPHFDDLDDGGAIWKGEALIDCEEYQPVEVHTTMTYKMPLAVKTLLGTDIKGLGFAVSYGKFDGGIWFPVSYGGEFRVRGLFFYRRTISVSLVNSDFRRADVTSTVAYAADEQ